MNNMMQLVKDGNFIECCNLFQVQHWVAWFDLDYGGNPEGIFTVACPSEALHALENGIFLHILKEVLDNIFQPCICTMFDAHIFTWNSYPGQHTMRSHAVDGYPRLLFTNYISGLTQLKADYKVGIIFALIIALVQVEGKSFILEKAMIKKCKNILYIFEKMLAY